MAVYLSMFQSEYLCQGKKMASLRYYQIKLLVTYEQETAIVDLFATRGWLFSKIGIVICTYIILYFSLFMHLCNFLTYFQNTIIRLIKIDVLSSILLSSNEIL